jgi:hypothetical protein
MPDIYLYQGEATPSDMRLRDPTPLTETIVSKEFPMAYHTGVSPEQLMSRVSGAMLIITKIANDFPMLLIKSSKAKELRSRFA